MDQARPSQLVIIASGAVLLLFSFMEMGGQGGNDNAWSEIGLITLPAVLGTIAALVFRTNRNDDAKADNTGKAFDAITAAANAGTTTADDAIKPGDTVTIDKPEGEQ